MIVEIKKAVNCNGETATCKCDNCQKIFFKRASHVVRGKHHFCSKDCFNSFRFERIPPKKIKIEIAVGYKKCGKCQKIKPIKDFYKDRCAKDGLVYCCGECSKEKNKTRYKDNPIAWAIYNKEYRKNNPDKVANTQKEWRKNHIEYRREYGRKYWENNTERCNERAREY